MVIFSKLASRPKVRACLCTYFPLETSLCAIDLLQLKCHLHSEQLQKPATKMRARAILGMVIFSLALSAWTKEAEPSSRPKGNGKASKAGVTTTKQVS